MIPPRLLPVVLPPPASGAPPRADAPIDALALVVAVLTTSKIWHL